MEENKKYKKLQEVLENNMKSIDERISEKQDEIRKRQEGSEEVTHTARYESLQNDKRGLEEEIKKYDGRTYIQKSSELVEGRQEPKELVEARQELEVVKRELNYVSNQEIQQNENELAQLQKVSKDIGVELAKVNEFLDLQANYNENLTKNQASIKNLLDEREKIKKAIQKLTIKEAGNKEKSSELIALEQQFLEANAKLQEYRASLDELRENNKKLESEVDKLCEKYKVEVLMEEKKEENMSEQEVVEPQEQKADEILTERLYKARLKAIKYDIKYIPNLYKLVHSGDASLEENITDLEEDIERYRKMIKDRVIHSSKYGDINLTDDMINTLEEALRELEKEFKEFKEFKKQHEEEVKPGEQEDKKVETENKQQPENKEGKNDTKKDIDKKKTDKKEEKSYVSQYVSDYIEEIDELINNFNESIKNNKKDVETFKNVKNVKDFLIESISQKRMYEEPTGYFYFTDNETLALSELLGRVKQSIEEYEKTFSNIRTPKVEVKASPKIEKQEEVKEPESKVEDKEEQEDKKETENKEQSEKKEENNSSEKKEISTGKGEEKKEETDKESKVDEDKKEEEEIEEEEIEKLTLKERIKRFFGNFQPIRAVKGFFSSIAGKIRGLAQKIFPKKEETKMLDEKQDKQVVEQKSESKAKQYINNRQKFLEQLTPEQLTPEQREALQNNDTVYINPKQFISGVVNDTLDKGDEERE